MGQNPNLYYAIAAVLMLTGCNKADGAPEQIAAEKIYPVEVSLVRAADNKEIISSVGTLRFRRETALGFTTSGKVSSVRYNEGDRVKRGALLAALDATNVSADINVARAERDRARAENERIETLFAQGWVTKARLEQSQANFQAAEARINQAQFASDTAKLYAPSNGIIITRNIDRGQIIAAGSPALVFGQVDSGYTLRIPLTSADAAKINVGMPVNITMSSIDDEQFSGTLTEIDGRADDRTGSFFATVELPSDNRFKSGQIGTANFTISSDRQIISVPASAISGIRSSEAILYIYDPKKERAKIRSVVLGKLNDNMINIVSGVSVGETIIVRGHEKLAENSRVKAVERGLSDQSPQPSQSISSEQ